MFEFYYPKPGNSSFFWNILELGSEPEAQGGGYLTPSTHTYDLYTFAGYITLLFGFEPKEFVEPVIEIYRVVDFGESAFLHEMAQQNATDWKSLEKCVFRIIVHQDGEDENETLIVCRWSG